MKRTQVSTLLVPAFCSILTFTNSAISQTASATSGPLTIDTVASGDQSPANGSVSTQSFSTPQANELLLAFVSTDSSDTLSNTVTSVSGGGLIWEFVTRANNQRGDAEVWRAFTPAPLSNVSVTAALSQSAAASITVVAFSGVDTSGSNGSGAVGASATFSAPTGAPSGSLVTTRNNSWVFAVGNDWDNAIARTPGPNQALVHQYFASVGDTYWVQQQNAVTPAPATTVTMNDTAPTGDQFNFALVEVLPAPSATPDFSLSATPSNQSVQAGSGTTYSAGIAAQNGFTGTVDLSVSGLPSGVTGTFSPSSVSGSGSSQLTINTDASTPAGSYPFTVTATSGSLTHTASLTLVVTAAPDFTLAVSPSSQSIQSGAATTFTASIAGQNGYAGAANLSVTGLPTGATAAFNPSSISGSGTSQLTITTSASTPAGSYELTVTADASAVTHTATATLVVNATTPSQLQIDTVSSGNRSSSRTSVSTGTFSTTQANDVLLAFVSSDSSETAGNAVTSVSGGGLTWQVVTRANQQLGDAEIWRAFAPAVLTGVSVTAQLSQSAAASITVVAFNGADTTSGDGASAIGATGAFSAVSGAPTGSLVTTRDNSWVFAVGNDWDNAIARTLGPNQTMVHQHLASVGDTYWVQRQSSLTATAGTSVAMNDTAPTGDRYNLALVEILPTSVIGTNPTFTLSATPSSQSVQPGSSTTYTVSIAAQSGYTGTANLSVSGLPSGATGTFNPSSITGSGSSQLSVTTAGSTPAGSYPVTITADTSGLMKSTTVTLVVGSAPDFTVSATPSTQSVALGASTSYTVNIAAQNGFSGSANLSVSGLPNGATGTFNPASVTGSGSSQLSIATASSTPAGSYPLTITASGGGLTHTASVTLTVTAASDFTLAVSPSSASVTAGQSTTYTLTITGQNGYAGTASVSVSGLPAGATGTFNPNSVTGSGTVQLTIATSTTTTAGTYPLTITVNSGSLTHTIGASLAVTAAVQHYVSLTWTDGDSGIAGYNMYRGTQSGGPYTKLNTSLIATTSWSDNAVQSGATYYYVVTAVNTSGVESAYSAPATATIPTP